MVARRPGDFILAADFAGSGNFISIGRMLAPSPAFAAALAGLQSGAEDAGHRNLLVYSLAANAAGLCILNSPEIEKALQACFAARLAIEWRIEFPGTGVLRALCLLARIRRTGRVPGLFELALQLAGKPAFVFLQANGA